MQITAVPNIEGLFLYKGRHGLVIPTNDVARAQIAADKIFGNDLCSKPASEFLIFPDGLGVIVWPEDSAVSMPIILENFYSHPLAHVFLIQPLAEFINHVEIALANKQNEGQDTQAQ